MARIYDVSVPIRDGGLVYPRNPEVHIALQQAVAQGASANVSSVSFGSHTGTHVDSARHFFDDATPVDQIPLDTLMGPAAVLAFDDTVMSVGRAELEPALESVLASAPAAVRVDGPTRVLLKTRNSSFLTQDATFHRDYTFLAPDGAAYLVERGVQLVGIDYLSIEQFHSGHHMTHRTLLEHNVVIVEGLDLHAVPAGIYDFRCLPLRLAGCDGAPARAVLIETVAPAPVAAV